MSRVAMLARRPDNRDRLPPIHARSRSGRGRRQRLRQRQRRLSPFVLRTRRFRKSGRCVRSLIPSQSAGGDKVRDGGRQKSVWLFPDPHPGERASFRQGLDSRADRDNEQRLQGTWAARLPLAPKKDKKKKIRFSVLCILCLFVAISSWRVSR